MTVRPCTQHERIQLNIDIMKNRIEKIQTELNANGATDNLEENSRRLFSDKAI